MPPIWQQIFQLSCSTSWNGLPLDINLTQLLILCHLLQSLTSGCRRLWKAVQLNQSLLTVCLINVCSSTTIKCWCGVNYTTKNTLNHYLLTVSLALFQRRLKNLELMKELIKWHVHRVPYEQPTTQKTKDQLTTISTYNDDSFMQMHREPQNNGS